jgi:hypothetical protein
MAYSGLVIKFKLNRSLNELEQSLHLKQDVRLAIEPQNRLSTIKLNSTYLEVVDKWFAWKGALSAFVLGFICLFGAAYVWLVYAPFTRERDFSSGDAALLIFVSCLILPFLTVLIWLLCKESFAYTHYPIRFNRKTRMVHVFRPKGKILSVPWDEVFFTVAKLNQRLECEVRGHLLSSDGKTVRDTFAFSHAAYISDLRVSPGQITFADSVRGHWEFIRRYMEEGPQNIESEVKTLMPVDARRETFSEGMQRVFANTADSHRFLYFLMYIPSIISGIVRAFAMRTSKIPQWPKDVDAVCVVEPGDPYAIVGGSHGIRIVVFPDDARAAGVRFSEQSVG